MRITLFLTNKGENIVAYIAPNTIVKILKNVPLDDTYEHTIYFGSATQQNTYFTGMAKYTLNEYTYQRVQRNKIRVQIESDNLYDCNYVMFQNTAFGSKWFYAFITSVEYINNTVSEITFEIDVMQTWFFDYQLRSCFVEREHVMNDTVGIHLEPEPVSVGEYVFSDLGYSDGRTYTSLTGTALTDMWIGVATVSQSSTTEESEPEPTLIDGVFSGAVITLYDNTPEGIEELKLTLKRYTTNPDNILGIYMIPKLLEPLAESGSTIPYSLQCSVFTPNLPKLSPNFSLDGYVPKNKKLLTYPFNFINVDNGNGSSLSLRYEFFSGWTPTFRIYGNISQPVTVTLRPTNYKNVGGQTCNTESLSISNYPICSWSNDAYQAYIAQNSIPAPFGGVYRMPYIQTLTNAGSSALVGGLMGGGVGAVIGAGVSAFSSIVNNMMNEYRASIASDITRGNVASGNANIADSKQQFYFGRCTLTAEIAQQIDEFFDMYGYAVNRLKVPNRNGRRHWNYVKTAGCLITGSVPGNDANKICRIYDHGITFWKEPSEIGDYSLDNTILQG